MHADGHRHLHCDCGKGTTVRRLRVGRNGKAIVPTQSDCSSCGSIRIQAGLWRADRFVKCQPGEQDHADWTFGNPLTFNDDVAASYGVPRYNAQEAVFGSQFTKRFALLRNKRWFRRQSQVELEVSMVICITRGLSLERYRRMTISPAGLTGGAPPPTTLAPNWRRPAHLLARSARQPRSPGPARVWAPGPPPFERAVQAPRSFGPSRPIPASNGTS